MENTESIEQAFVKMLAYPQSNPNDELHNNIEEKAAIHEISLTESIDMTMVLIEPAVSGWILPMVAIEPGNIFGDSSFNNFPIDFNGLNGFEVF